MAEVKWIKLMTDLPDNKKIKKIRRMPEGNNIVLLWVFLLLKAGESNMNGGLFITDTIPYTEEDLAGEFGLKLTTIQLGLRTLESLGMLELFDSVIYIKNWGEYQNVESLDKIKKQNAIRAKRYREKKKLQESNVTDNVTEQEKSRYVTHLDIDKEEDIDKDKEREEDIGANAPVKHSLIYYVNIWNKECHLNDVKRLTDKRKPMLSARLKEHGEDGFKTVIDNINNSPFLKGQNDRGWTANFDWVIKPNNYVKVLEGTYDAKGGNDGRTSTSNTKDETDGTDAESILRARGIID